MFGALALVISAAFVGRLASLVGSLRAITKLGAMPPWLAAIGGLTALGLTPDAKTGSDAEVAGHALGAEPSKQGAAIDSMSPGDRTKFLWKHRPKWLGGEGMQSGNDALRMRGGGGSKGGGKIYRDQTNYTGDNAAVVRQAAAQLGTSPEDLAMVISYETGGSFSPKKWGGAKRSPDGHMAETGHPGDFLGLIQFGHGERAAHGANENQTFAEQMPAVVGYLKSRGFKPGMKLIDLYSTINAGRPGRYGASDGYGTVSSHVERMQREHAGNVKRFLESSLPVRTPPMLRPKNADPSALREQLGIPSTSTHTLTIKPEQTPAPLGLPSVAPLGSAASFDNSRPVTIHDNSRTTIQGVDDPAKAAGHVASADDRRQATLLRNLQSAIG